MLAVDDWSTLWRCGCGYGNAGRDRCLMCGAKAPTEVQGTPGLEADVDSVRAEVSADAAAGRAGRKAGRTVVAMILLNLGIQAVEVAIFIATRTPTALAIRISLFSGLFFYGFSTLWVLARSAELGLRPTTGRRKGLVGAAEGFVVGGALAVLLVAVMRIALGHPVLDPTTSLIASSSLGPLLLGIVLVVIAAPVVEELVFRGFLAEALRGRGRRVAGLLSAAAFSIAHLRFEQFRYYVGMGLVLFYMYWRRGLSGSVAAHAAFNGMLFVAALAVAHGPAITLTASGATVTLPGTWQPVDARLDGDVAAMGPAGAWMGLGHQEVEVVGVAPEHFAQDLRTGRFVLPPEMLVDLESISVIDLPAGRAVSMEAEIHGHEGRVVALLGPDRVWWLTLTTGGSERAKGDFNDALLSLELR